MNLIDILDQLDAKLTPETWIKLPGIVVFDAPPKSRRGCILMHLNTVLNLNHTPHSLFPSLADFNSICFLLSTYLPEGYHAITDFNDAPETTLEDMKLLIKKVRHSLEEKIATSC